MLEDLNVLTCDGQGYSESSPKSQLPENGGLGNQGGPSGCRQNARLRCVCVFAESWTNCCVSFKNPPDQFSWFGLKFCGELGQLTATLCERLLCCVLKKRSQSGYSTMESVDFRRNPRPSCERKTHTQERPACSGGSGQVYTKSNTDNITKSLLPVVESSGKSTDNAMRAWLLALD